MKLWIAAVFVLLSACVPPSLTPGVYTMTPGPSTETPAPTATLWFLTPTPEEGTAWPTDVPFRYGLVTATLGLHVRAGPDIHTPVIGVLAYGEIVFIVGESAGVGVWYELERGWWVSAAYVRMETL